MKIFEPKSKNMWSTTQSVFTKLESMQNKNDIPNQIYILVNKSIRKKGIELQKMCHINFFFNEMLIMQNPIFSIFKYTLRSYFQILDIFCI